MDKKKIDKIIHIHTVEAAAVGAIPIPFSDAILLTAIQMNMIRKISEAYGIEVLEALTKGLITDVVLTNLGRTVAGSLIKCVPGAGYIVGGTINAGIASSITYSLGKVVNHLCYNKAVLGKDVKDITVKKIDRLMQKYIKKK